MAYKIRFLPGAQASIDRIMDYLAQFYAGNAAVKFGRRLKNAIHKLSDHPYLAQQDEDNPKYRLLVVDQYLVYYLVDDEAKTVSIYRVLRASWNLKPE